MSCLKFSKTLSRDNFIKIYIFATASISERCIGHFEVVMRLSRAIVLTPIIFILGCSIHPLPEDVGELNTAQIVEQIRCEAREALRAHAYPSGYILPSEQAVEAEAIKTQKNVHLESVFKLINSLKQKNIEIIHNDVFVRSRDISGVKSAAEFENVLKYDNKITKNACEIDDLPGCQSEKATPELRSDKQPGGKPGSLKRKIIDFATSTYINGKCIANEFTESDKRIIATINSISGVPPQTLNLGHIYKTRGEIIKELNCLEYKNRFYQSQNMYLSEFTDPPGYLPKAKGKDKDKELRAELKRWCNISPGQTTCRGGLKVQAIVLSPKDKENQRVKMAQAVLVTEFKDVAIAYDFDFKMTDKDNSGLGLGFNLPFSNGSFGLGSEITEEKIRSSTRTFTLAENVDHLLSDPANCLRSGSNWKYPLSGEIGLNETVKTYLHLTTMPSSRKKKEVKTNEGSTQPKAEENFKGNAFTDKLEFTTDINGSISPVLSLNPVPNAFRLVSATPTVGRGRKDVHAVTITFAQADRQEITANLSDVFPEGLPQGALSKPSAVTCSDNKCILRDTGKQLNIKPPADDFQGTIQCEGESCSIQSNAPVGESATDKALEILERRRGEESLRDVIREELIDR